MREQKVTIPLEKFNLEGILASPEQEKAEPVPGVVICHPHPLYGGDMNNNVVLAINDEAVKRGMVALRFNFRGTGNSQGNFAEGIGEQDDVLAAIQFLAESETIDPGAIGLAGYSFGAMVAVAAAPKNNQIQGVAAVSPVVYPGLFQPVQKPLFVMCGEDDAMTPLEHTREELKKSSRDHTLKTMPGVDHFWLGYEEALAQQVADFFQNTLKT